MKLTIDKIDRVTVEYEPGTSELQVCNPRRPNFYLIAAKVVAEFDADNPSVAGLRSVEVTGMDGRIRPSAGLKQIRLNLRRRNNLATWKFGGSQIPSELHPLLRVMFESRVPFSQYVS